jgi:hypothetical protein
MIQQFHSWIYIQRKEISVSKKYLHYCVYCNTVHNNHDMESWCSLMMNGHRKVVIYTNWKHTENFECSPYKENNCLKG